MSCAQSEVEPNPRQRAVCSSSSQARPLRSAAASLVARLSTLVACLSVAALGCGDSGEDASATGGAAGNNSGGSAGSAQGGSAGVGIAGGGGSAPGGAAGQGGAAGASGGSAGSAGSGGVPDDGRVAVFAALGHVGRSVVSCDHGRTWVADQSQDDDLRCWGNGGPDCDHSSNSGVDLIYTDGRLLRTLGWGAPGGVSTSTDGETWTPLSSDTSWSALTYGRGKLIAYGGWGSATSDNLGAAWTPLDIGLNATSRRALFFPHNGGRFIVYGDAHVAYSDDGVAWTVARDVLPTGCGGTFAYGNGVLLLSGDVVCRSTDGGASWQVSRAARAGSTTWTGGEFQAWADGKLLRSSDGQSWTETNVSPAGLNLGPVARTADGHYAAVHQSWDNYYGAQKFYRSDDGVTWTEAESYSGGHPINRLVSARLATCPTQ